MMANAGLNLDNRDLTDKAMSYIASLKKLRLLDVFSARVSDAGLSTLQTLATSLTGLELCGGRVTDRGLSYIAKMTALRSLNLSQVRRDPRGEGWDEGSSAVSTLMPGNDLRLHPQRTESQNHECGPIAPLDSAAPLCPQRLALPGEMRQKAGRAFLGRMSLPYSGFPGWQVEGPGAVPALTRLRGLETLALNGLRGMTEGTVKELRQSLPYLKHVRVS